LTQFPGVHYDAGVMPRLLRAIAVWAAGLVLVCSGAVYEVSAQPRQPEGLIRILTPDGKTILAEVADTTEERARGLMYRQSLPTGHGMLFTFSEPQLWTFWMKNTRIPLDIVWMNREKRIVHIERNVPACSRQDDGCPQYQPTEDALYVLEVGAGQSEALHLNRGVKLQFDLSQAAPSQPSHSGQGTPVR
jgi:uncharacterized membrane protein (UPF0127 family)